MSTTIAYIGLAMSIFFVVIGVIFPFNPPQSLAALGLTQAHNYFIGVILVMYGIFRFTRAYKMLKRSKEK